MRRLITNVLVSFLTFSIGVTIVMLKRFPSPTKPLQINVPNMPVNPSRLSQSRPIAVSICDLRNEPALYKGKLLVLNGVLYSTHGDLLLYEDCSNFEKGVPVVAVDLEGLNSSLIRLLNNLEGSSKRPKMEADAKVIGMVEYDAAGSFSDIRLDTFDINLSSTLRRFRPKGAA